MCSSQLFSLLLMLDEKFERLTGKYLINWQLNASYSADFWLFIAFSFGTETGHTSTGFQLFRIKLYLGT